MPTTLDLSGLSRLHRRLALLKDPDATPLMASWMKTVADGNRRGVLAGLDGDGRPMAPVTYRPKGGILKPTRAQKNTDNARARRGAFAGFGVHAAGLHNNLTSSEYRRLAGPPLAPRGAFSRTIANFMVDYAKLRVGLWQVTYWWQDVASRKGVSFLRYHFDGATGGGRRRSVTLPRRDLRGIRPDDERKVQASLKAWMIDLIRRWS